MLRGRCCWIWSEPACQRRSQAAPLALLDNGAVPDRRSMASEIFGTAALFWVLIPVGLAGGALLLKLADRE